MVIGEIMHPRRADRSAAGDARRSAESAASRLAPKGVPRDRAVRTWTPGGSPQTDHRCRGNVAPPFPLLPLLTSPRRLYRHGSDLGPRDRGACLYSGFFRRQALVPMRREKAPSGHAAGAITAGWIISRPTLD